VARLVTPIDTPQPHVIENYHRRHQRRRVHRGRLGGSLPTIVRVFLLMPIGESHQAVVDRAADILRVEGDAQVRLEIGGLPLGKFSSASAHPPPVSPLRSSPKHIDFQRVKPLTERRAHGILNGAEAPFSQRKLSPELVGRYISHSHREQRRLSDRLRGVTANRHSADGASQ
jgi:hypothetical protein